MVYGTQITIATGVYKPTYNWGASHCRYIFLVFMGLFQSTFTSRLGAPSCSDLDPTYEFAMPKKTWRDNWIDSMEYVANMVI